MDRRQFIGMATGAAAFTLGAPLVARAQKKYVCRIATAEALGTPMTKAFDAFAAAMAKESGGALDVKHFPANQLGGLSELLEMSRIGSIQITASGPETDESVAPEIAPTGGAPGYMFDSYEHVDRVLQGEIGEEVSQIAKKKTGVEFLAFGEVGFRHFLSKTPFTDLQGFQGTRIRSPDVKVWLTLWQTLGASPIPLAWMDQYDALSTGLITALEADPFSIVGFKWYELARNLTLSTHYFAPKAIRVNSAWLASLPAELQTVVRTSAKQAFADQRTENRAGVEKAIETLKTSGVEVRELTDKQAWRERATPLLEEYGKKSPETKAMIERIRALSTQA